MRIATSLCVRRRLSGWLALGAPESQAPVRRPPSRRTARDAPGPRPRCPPRRAPHAPCARACGEHRRGEGGVVALAGGRGRPSGRREQGAEEALAGGADQDGEAQLGDAVRPASRARSCSGCLAKPRPGSTTICSAATPAASAASTRRRTPAAPRHDVVVPGLGVHVAAVAPPVHEHPRDAGVGDDRSHGGIGQSAADVVHHPGARREGGGGHGRPGGVDADRDPAPAELGDHGQDPAALLVGGHAAGARPRRLAPDVDVVRAGGRHVSPWATAASTVSWRPPSENESGVTLRMPMTTQRPGRAIGAS